MSPVERLKEVTEKTRISIPLAALLTTIGTTAGIVGAGYAARDTAVNQIRQTVAESASVERARSDERYITRDEFLRSVLPELKAMRVQLDQVLDRDRR